MGASICHSVHSLRILTRLLPVLNCKTAFDATSVVPPASCNNIQGIKVEKQTDQQQKTIESKYHVTKLQRKERRNLEIALAISSSSSSSSVH